MDLTQNCHYSYNWLMYLHFIKQDASAIKQLYSELPEERRDEQMYKTVEGLSAKLQGSLQESNSQLIEAIHYNALPQDTNELSVDEKLTDNTTTTKHADALAEYLNVEALSTIALQGLFQTALASVKRLSSFDNTTSAGILWKLPLLRAWIVERQLSKDAVDVDEYHSDGGEQQINLAAVAECKTELASLLTWCSEEAVYETLCRFSNPTSMLTMHASSSSARAAKTGAETQFQSKTNNSLRTNSVKALLEPALQRHPLNIDLMNVLMQSFLLDEHYDAALKTLMAFSNNGNLYYNHNTDMSFVSGLAGDIDAALTRAKLAASQSAYNSAAWNNIGVSLLERRKHVTGIGSMRLSRALDVTNPVVAHNLGFVHLKMGLYASATIFLTAAYRYEGSGQQNASTVFLLSICVRELGNASLAHKLLLQAARLAAAVRPTTDMALVVFLIPALIAAGEYNVAIQMYQQFADIVKYLRADSIRHQQMRRADLAPQLDYFATHVPDIIRLLKLTRQEELSTTTTTTRQHHQ